MGAKNVIVFPKLPLHYIDIQICSHILVLLHYLYGSVNFVSDNKPCMEFTFLFCTSMCDAHAGCM